MHSDFPWILTALARYVDWSTSIGFTIVSMASPVFELNDVIYSSSSEIISSFSRHQMTSGIGIPFTTHLNSIDFFAFTFFGLIGSIKVGASPISSESKLIIYYIRKILNIFIKCSTHFNTIINCISIINHNIIITIVS